MDLTTVDEFGSNKEYKKAVKNQRQAAPQKTTTQARNRPTMEEIRQLERQLELTARKTDVDGRNLRRSRVKGARRIKKASCGSFKGKGDV